MESQNGEDTAAMVAMIGDWREDALNLDELLQTTSGQNPPQNSAIQSQAPSSHNQNAQQYMGDEDSIQKPTFGSSANRPSVLDLSTSVKVGVPHHFPVDNNMNGHHSPHSPHHQQRSVSPHTVQSPHSPHHSPYMNNQQTVFNYNNTPQEQHSPVSPHAQPLHSPVSPHQRSVSPHHHTAESATAGPMSPHHMAAGQMSPHHQMAPQAPPLSPHSPFTNMANQRSVSPHPHQNMVSPVSPHQLSNHSGGMSPHHGGMHSGGMSPHHHSGSVSPVPRQLSPTPGASSVFGRYAGSPVSMHSGNSSDTDSYYGYTDAQIAEMRKRGINIDKNSDMYKAKRERNNVAVRKSREKKKQREQETERRVKDLSDENSSLQNKLDIALKEMNLLKNLYKNIGVQLPQEARNKLERELAKFK